MQTNKEVPSNKREVTHKSNSGRSHRSSSWLQTWVVTGSLAATVVGAGLINRMEAMKSTSTDDETTAVGSDPLLLAPIPTILVPPVATGEMAAILPTVTPILIPTDTPPPTYAPEVLATPVVLQQSSAAQSSSTTRVQRRSRSSR